MSDAEMVLRMDTGDVTGEPRPVASWTNDLLMATAIELEPSFKPELGTVFLKLRRVDDGPRHARQEIGIWLPTETVADIREALDVVDAYSRSLDGDEDR